MIITFIAELVAFVIIVAIIVRIIMPKYITPALVKQQELVHKQVEDSDEAKRKLAEAEKSYQGAVTEARTEAAQIRENSRAEAQRSVEDLKTQAREEADRIVARGEEQLANLRAAVVRDLRAEIGSLAVDLSEQIVNQRLSDDAAVAATVDAFLAELETTDSASGRTSRAATATSRQAHTSEGSQA